MCLPSTMVTRTRELMNASILDCRLTATIIERHCFYALCVLVDIFPMNETTKEQRAFLLSLSFGIQFFLSNRMCFVKRFWYAREQRESLSLSLSLSLDSSSSIVPLKVASSKKSSGSASRRVRVCACALSLFSLSSLLLSSNNFLGSQKSDIF